MNNLVGILFSVGVLISCNKGDDPDNNIDSGLIGTWKLTQIVADPGNGSGTFTDVESDKILTFHGDGTITSNGDLCTMSIQADNPTAGSYSVSESAFTSPDCFDPEYNFTFEHNGTVLIVTYFCIELCKAKYEKE